MSLGLAIGIVIDLGGLLGQGEGSTEGGDSTSDSGGGDGILESVASAIGGVVDERRMIRVPLRNIPRAIKSLRMLPLLLPSLALAADKAGGKSFLSRLAIYVGGIFDIGIFYVTVGGCFGGFGCAAAGGGLKFGNFGIGVLFPFWKWW